MQKKDNITFYKAQDSGKGLPFAIVSHEELMANNDLFTPSLRDFHVIFWFKKGKGKYYIDFTEHTLEPNSIILISKDYLHYFEPFQKECELQSIVFSPDFIYRKDTDLKHLFNFKTGCHVEGVQVLKLEESSIGFFTTVSNQMHTVYHEWEGIARNECFYHLLSIFLIKCEELQDLDDLNVVVDEDAKLLIEFNNLLEEHFRTTSKVEFYSDKMGLSVKNLSRIVKDKYTISTKALIDERRTLEIKRQLKGTTKAIKEIAYEVGFDEPTNMIKYFKKHVGKTPIAFREEEVG